MSLPREILAKYMTTHCHLFIETGTKWGDTAIRAAELGADKVITIEGDSEMFQIAHDHVKDAAPWADIEVRYGDSAPQLRKLDRDVFAAGRVIVFLDAHTESESFVHEELDAIFSWNYLPDVILIDDISLMRAWSVNPLDLETRLLERGYKISYENGRGVSDILVGVIK